MPARVVRLGGSLLDFADVRSALRRWLAAQPPAVNVVVVGGGELADAIRRFDRLLAVGEDAAHWLCIDAMSVTARMATSLWPEFSLVTRFADLTPAVEEGRDPLVFDTHEFLRSEEPQVPGVVLVHGWAVTSDSIAARVAEAIAADELALLKSTLPERSPTTCQDAAAAGFVDGFFPRAAQSLPRIRAVNLRSPTFAEAQLVP